MITIVISEFWVWFFAILLCISAILSVIKLGLDLYSRYLEAKIIN